MIIQTQNLRGSVLKPTKAKKEMAKAKNKTSSNGKEKAAKLPKQEPEKEVSLTVMKTYKMYIGGQFPRTESGRYFKLNNPQGQLIANVCQASRKDFRNAVVAARKAFPGWAGRTAYNRSQIIYRMAEMLEGRKGQFVEELIQLGYSPKEAEQEVRVSIDRLVYYAGWADKYQQIFSSVNPVASSHFNFSVLEPMGVVAVLAPQKAGLLGLISTVIPAITGGNTVIVLASETNPISAVSFAEVLQTSDLPGGVINILTGYSDELRSQFASHMDVNAVISCEHSPENLQEIEKLATHNLKRVFTYHPENWLDEENQNPYLIADLQETKTTWHPIGR